MQPHNLPLHNQHCAFWIALQQTAGSTGWLNWLTPETKMKGYFLSIAQRTNHLIIMCPYNQYQRYLNHLPTIYPNSVYCPNPFLWACPIHMSAMCTVHASIRTHKLTAVTALHTATNKQNQTAKPNNYACLI